MSWAAFNSSTDMLLYDNAIQIWEALHERCKALAYGQFPERVNKVWGGGTITSATLTTLTDDDAAWSVAPPRWVGWTVPGSPELPPDYDVILNSDDLDPAAHVRAQITGNTENELTFTSIENAVTAKWISSVGSLAGKQYVILKRNGLWWSDFWPTRPNDHPLWNGNTGAVSVTVFSYTGASGNFAGKTFSGSSGTGTIHASSGGTLVIDWQTTAPSGSFTILDGGTPVATGSVSGTVRDGLWREQADFPAGAFNGKDLLISNGKLYRINIISNTATTILFAKRSSAYNGNGFNVLANGGRGEHIRKKDYPFIWYGGVSKRHYTKKVHDELFNDAVISTVPTAAQSVTYQVDSGSGCVDFTETAFEKINLWTSVESECPPADECLAPDFIKSLHGIQAWIEEYCNRFVPKGNYHGRDGIPNYTPATLFYDLDMGRVMNTTVASDDDGEVTFNIPSNNETYHWTLFNPREEVNATGTSSATTMTFDGLAHNKPYTLVAAKGWTRKFQRRVHHIYPRSGFIPDIDSSGLSPAIVSPPTEEYPGYWEHRPASTHYCELDDHGFHADTGPAFITNVKARYRGDNWGDPVTDAVDDGEPLDATRFRDLWLGRFEKGARRTAYTEMKTGDIAYGDRKWFKQVDYDWWGYPIGTGDTVIKLHSGTATSGGSTSLTDTTKTWIPPGGSTPEISPFWNTPDNGPRFVGMMLEVDKTVNDVNGNPQTVTYHTPITGHSSYTVTFQAVGAYVIPAGPGTAQINVPSLTVSAGTVYRIKEPHRLNWFKDRKVIITKGVVSETKTITHHDQEYMWLDSNTSFAIDATCTFKIVELNPGYVYKWDGSQWVVISGSKAGNQLHPDIVKTFGKIRNDDFVGLYIFQELKAAINKLVWTTAGIGWISNEELNDYLAQVQFVFPDTWPISQGGDCDSIDEALSAKRAYLSSNWDPTSGPIPIAISGDGITPHFSIDLSASAPGRQTSNPLIATLSSITITRGYSYPQTTVPYTGFNCAIQWYCHSVINSLDPEEGITQAWEITPPTGGASWYKSHFNPTGTPLIWRKWASVGSQGPSNALVRTGTQKVGNLPLDVPTFEDLPDPIPHVPPTGDPYPAASAVATEGYHIDGALAILKWDVEGGFTYVAGSPAPLTSYGSIFGTDTPIAMDGSLE